MINKVAICFVLAVILSACSTKFQEKIGAVTTGPNEYKVQTNKSLDVPPHYNLPTPEKYEVENNNSKSKKKGLFVFK